MKFFEMALPKDHLLVNTPIATKSALTDARHVAMNYFDPRLSFTLAAVGLLSMRHLKQILFAYLKIDRSPRGYGLKFVAENVTLI
jgi:hypothetical protein